MGIFGDFKRQLKKRIRLKRRWLTLGMILMLIGCGVWAFASVEPKTNTWSWTANVHDSIATFQLLGTVPQSPGEVNAASPVLLQRIFVCGEEEQALGDMSPEQIGELAREHPNWEFEAKANGSVLFTERVDDLSDQCKMDSFIGVDGAGNLTLYRGLPGEERAVKTFFQLDIEYLESAMPVEALRQLREGIRITDISDYNSVISTFSDFAVEDTENVLKPGM